ncbi:exodeoxyribonuclease V subunit beta [Malikia granosa]|uniref:RecBCD enzyme subunit RecB n=1 Tax=Malikia granosa TaxID=263067 RepID=A0A2S9K0W2_9BURK|nr:exodeoxyribonuclease V subunit beta [Malikia granosa]PRD64074.1 exodeoxyribonuclease V subunit beta [Malikia granosa]
MTQTPSAEPQALIAENFPLWGSRLIEASAGTGKTWTIAALYLRLVLGHGKDATATDPGSAFGRPLAPSEILVMTFTKAATRELSDRIRKRLLEASRCFRGEQAVDARDKFLAQLMQDYPAGPARKQAAWRLAVAAESMDEASVHTIDAWCQRMLREHAFDSGNLFDEELVADEQALLVEAVQDYWRSECYPLSADLLQQVLGIWKDIDALRKDVAQLIHLRIETQNPEQSLQDLITGWARPLQNLLIDKDEKVEAMEQWLQQQLLNHPGHWNGNRLQPASVRRWFDQLTEWAEQKTPLCLPDLGTGLVRLTPSGLRQARTVAAPALVEIPPAFEWFESVVTQYQQNPFSPRLRRHAAGHVARRLDRLKRQSRSFGFADMLDRLGSALHGPHGARLRERILMQYPVALIDEFQDTSPLQYDIFDQIYRSHENSRERALLLIGDPKQSIYGFRGADIYSYLRARQATEGRHYVLGINYRSTAALVDAVNHCFLQAEQKPLAAFRFASAQGNPLPFVKVAAQGRSERLVGPQGDLPALTLVHDLELQNGDSIKARFAERCAEQIASWLNEPDTGFAKNDGSFERLRPSDIAVLVRTGKEAAAVRLAMQQRGIASVYLSDKESVFQSDEARDLVHWLRGVAMPQDAALVRAALATGSLGLSLDELGHVASDDEAFDRHSARLLGLHQVWQQQGVLAMLRQTLHQFQLASRWLDQDLGGERRLTNFLHLAELMQNASRQLDGEQALIRWLQQQIEDEASDSDDRIIRLESDADLVKVITIHKSKGLEFPLVCLPFPTSFREVNAKSAKVLSLPDGPGTRQVILDPDKTDMERADQERLREDLRLLYVALTRPRHALWIGFAALRVGNGQDCQSHKSAIGYLFGEDQALSPQQWQKQLVQLAQGCQAIALHAASHTTACTRLAAGGTENTLMDAPQFGTPIERDWTIASYSRLTSSLKETGPAPSSMRSPRASDDEVTLGADKEERVALLAIAAPLQQAASSIQHAFKRGPFAGNFLHEQLEWLAGRGFGLESDPQLGEQLLQRLQHSDYGERADEVLEWLKHITTTPLPGPGAALAQLHTARAEMEFWLPLERIRIDALDQACREHLLPGVERPALQSSVVHGMLMGFADLVFEHEGRYWVLDYKSNHLGQDDQDYGSDAIAQAMARHRYDVQAAIYLSALHRLLSSRLGESYDPQQHLGGAVFLFLRGIHHPGRGACVLQPGTDFYSQLDAMLGNEEVCA